MGDDGSTAVFACPSCSRLVRFRRMQKRKPGSFMRCPVCSHSEPIEGWKTANREPPDVQSQQVYEWDEKGPQIRTPYEPHQPSPNENNTGDDDPPPAVTIFLTKSFGILGVFVGLAGSLVSGSAEAKAGFLILTQLSFVLVALSALVKNTCRS